MKINNDFEITDEVSGLKISIGVGKKLNWITIKHIGKPLPNIINRQFFFAKDGEFDGTGSDLKT